MIKYKTRATKVLLLFPANARPRKHITEFARAKLLRLSNGENLSSEQIDVSEPRLLPSSSQCIDFDLTIFDASADDRPWLFSWTLAQHLFHFAVLWVV